MSRTKDQICADINNGDYSSLDLPGTVTSTKKPTGKPQLSCTYNINSCEQNLHKHYSHMPLSSSKPACTGQANSYEAKFACQQLIDQKDTLIANLQSCGQTREVATSTFNNVFCPCVCNRKNCADKKKLSIGAIVGIVIGSITFLVICILYKKGKLHLNLNFLHRKHFVTKINIKPKKK